jgi:hypothetical protein
MGMRVDEPGDDPPALDVYLAGLLGELEPSPGTYELDDSVPNDNCGIVQGCPAGSID